MGIDSNTNIINGVLPSGWELYPISKIIVDTKNINPESEPNRLFKYVDIGSINNSTFKIESFKTYLGKDAPSRARRQIKTNDIIFSNVRTYLRNIAIVPEYLNGELCSTGFSVLRPSDKVDSKFLFYYSITDKFIENVTPLQRGSQYPATSEKVVKSGTIPIPPLDEQQQIVARIEKLLARVDAAKERLDRVPTIMQQFRQSVLAAACSGSLLEENANDIEWKTVEFKSVVIGQKEGIKTGPFGSMLKKFEHQPDGVPVWGIENVKRLQFLPHNKIFITKEKAEQLSNYDIVPGDILLTRSGTVGEICVVSENVGESRFSSNLMRIRLNTKIINPYFCCFLLYGSPSVLQQISDSCGGSTRIFIDGKILKSLKISYPPLEEQLKIINRVNALYALATRIEAQVTAARERVETITQSILHQAFTGKLVPTRNESE